MQSQEYSLPIVLRSYASSTTRWPSTVQRTAQRRSFQTKYLMRSAFNISFLPGVLIDPSGLNRQVSLCSSKCRLQKRLRHPRQNSSRIESSRHPSTTHCSMIIEYREQMDVRGIQRFVLVPPSPVEGLQLLSEEELLNRVIRAKALLGLLNCCCCRILPRLSACADQLDHFVDAFCHLSSSLRFRARFRINNRTTIEPSYFRRTLGNA